MQDEINPSEKIFHSSCGVELEEPLDKKNYYSDSSQHQYQPMFQSVQRKSLILKPQYRLINISLLRKKSLIAGS